MQSVMTRMMHAGLARGFDHWLSTLESKSKVNKRQAGYMRYIALRKLSRTWAAWVRNANEQVARGRIRDTFKFQKPADPDAHLQSV